MGSLYGSLSKLAEYDMASARLEEAKLALRNICHHMNCGQWVKMRQQHREPETCWQGDEQQAPCLRLAQWRRIRFLKRRLAKLTREGDKPLCPDPQDYESEQAYGEALAKWESTGGYLIPPGGNGPDGKIVGTPIPEDDRCTCTKLRGAGDFRACPFCQKNYKSGCLCNGAGCVKCCGPS